MKRILCYGDSNTWGYTPPTGERYPGNVRWTGVLAKELGAEYEILEDGINGRTTVWNSPYYPCRNGMEGLGYSLFSARPLDLIVLMLGTNDLNYTDAWGYYRGLSAIVRRILNAPAFYQDSSAVFVEKPRILLVSPITLHPQIAQIRPDLACCGRYEDSCHFAEFTARVAEEFHVPWVDAASCACASAADGLHLTESGHRAIGEMLARYISAMEWN